MLRLLPNSFLSVVATKLIALLQLIATEAFCMFLPSVPSLSKIPESHGVCRRCLVQAGGLRIQPRFSFGLWHFLAVWPGTQWDPSRIKCVCTEGCHGEEMMPVLGGQHFLTAPQMPALRCSPPMRSRGRTRGARASGDTVLCFSASDSSCDFHEVTYSAALSFFI